MNAGDFDLNKVKRLAEKYQAGFAVAVKRDNSMIDYLLISHAETLKYTIGDSGKTRKKSFQDRVDFELILGAGGQ